MSRMQDDGLGGQPRSGRLGSNCWWFGGKSLLTNRSSENLSSSRMDLPDSLVFVDDVVNSILRCLVSALVRDFFHVHDCGLSCWLRGSIGGNVGHHGRTLDRIPLISGSLSENLTCLSDRLRQRSLNGDIDARLST